VSILRAVRQGYSTEPRRTEVWLDWLARDRSDLLEEVQVGRMRTKTAARAAGIYRVSSSVNSSQVARGTPVAPQTGGQSEPLRWLSLITSCGGAGFTAGQVVAGARCRARVSVGPRGGDRTRQQSRPPAGQDGGAGAFSRAPKPRLRRKCWSFTPPSLTPPL
jgi:hypothetical protein